MSSSAASNQHTVELKHRLKELSYSEMLYVAIQTNSIDSIRKLLNQRQIQLTGGAMDKLLRCFKPPTHAANERMFYSVTYYRVPQTDEFAAIAGGANDEDEVDEENSHLS